MCIIQAFDPCVHYFGKWTFAGNRRYTHSAYSAAMLSFTGNTVECTVLTGPDMGTARVYLDGVPGEESDLYSPLPREKIIFTKKDLPAGVMHTIRVAAGRKESEKDGTAGLEIVSFRAEEGVNYPEWIKKRMQDEYRIIRTNGKKWTGPETWKPVPYGAHTPERGVTLLPGLFRKLFCTNIDNIKRCFLLPDYCEGDAPEFVRRMNIPGSARGWSAWLPASNEGRLLAGAAQALRWEEDPELRGIVNVLAEKIRGRMRDDGYYNYYPEELSFAVRHYPENLHSEETAVMSQYTERKNYDRVFWTRGLIAAHTAGNPGALSLARRMYDWFNAADEFLPGLLMGGNATNGFPGGPLMYHTPLGKAEDIITGKRYLDQEYWMEALAEKHPLAFSHYPGERPHCYALLALEAFADEYRATGESPYLDALLGGWELYRENYKHIGGATAICEMDGPYPPGSYYLVTGHNGETCGSVFWIWINHKLMRLFPGEEKYAGEIEEALVNIMLACRTEKGHTRYHNRLHGKKEGGMNQNSCCEVSSANLVSSIPEYIFMIGENGLFINLYLASEFHGEGYHLKIETNFPEDGAVAIVFLEGHREGVRDLMLRIPAWAAGTVPVFVNGDEAARGKAGSYTKIRRNWKTGDTIRLTLPFALRTEEYTGFDQSETNRPRYAVFHGPVLLALTGSFSEKDIPRLLFAACAAGEFLVSKGKNCFEVKDRLFFEFKPYYEVQDETFTCFPVFDP